MENNKAIVGEWISVEDRLPKNHCRVLVWDSDYEQCRIAKMTTKNEWYYPFKNADNITHWMPLPNPPLK